MNARLDNAMWAVLMLCIVVLAVGSLLSTNEAARLRTGYATCVAQLDSLATDREQQLVDVDSLVAALRRPYVEPPPLEEATP